MGAAREFSDRERKRPIEAAAALRQAERPVGILRSVAWPEDAYGKFMAAKAQSLPDAAYTSPDSAPTHARTAAARRLTAGSSTARRRRIAGCPGSRMSSISARTWSAQSETGNSTGFRPRSTAVRTPP